MDQLVKGYFNKHNIKYAEVSTEILNLLELKHVGIDPTKKIEDLLNNKFVGLLEYTFTEKVVFWYTEVITEEIVKVIHAYFRNKCCNIQNIILLTSTSGLKDYYQRYCELERSYGMKIIEIPLNHLDEYYVGLIDSPVNKNITKVFSYYGGTYDIDPPERTFLTLFAAQFADVASVEIFAKCKEKHKIESWLEHQTFFMDADFVKNYLQLHSRCIDNDLIFDKNLALTIDAEKVKNEKFGTGSYQEIVDSHCLFNFIRETVNFESFAFISEKTFRCFYNHLIPIPVSGNKLIDDLKVYGFWIADDLFDYSYLNQAMFKDRLNGLKQSIEKVSRLSNKELNEYYQDNLDKFKQNQTITVNWHNAVKTQLNINF